MESIGVSSYLQPPVDSSIYKGGLKGDRFAMECRVYNEDPANWALFTINVVVHSFPEREWFMITIL